MSDGLQHFFLPLFLYVAPPPTTQEHKNNLIRYSGASASTPRPIDSSTGERADETRREEREERDCNCACTRKRSFITRSFSVRCFVDWLLIVAVGSSSCVLGPNVDSGLIVYFFICFYSQLLPTINTYARRRSQIRTDLDHGTKYFTSLVLRRSVFFFQNIVSLCRGHDSQWD